MEEGITRYRLIKEMWVLVPHPERSTFGTTVEVTAADRVIPEIMVEVLAMGTLTLAITAAVTVTLELIVRLFVARLISLLTAICWTIPEKIIDGLKLSMWNQDHPEDMIIFAAEPEPQPF